MWRATLKGLLAKKIRLVLTALAVVLGVGFVAGTFVLTDTMNRAFDELFSTATEDTDVQVRSEAAFTTDLTGGAGGGGGGGGQENREPVPEDMLALVKGVEGVERAVGDISGYAQIVDPTTDEAIGGMGPPTIGVAWDEGTSILTMREGEPPTNAAEVAIDAATAKRYDLHVGDPVKVLFQGPARPFTISGIAGFGEADNLGGATLAIFDFETAQAVLGKEGELDSISVVASESVSATELRARIAAELPEGYEAVTGATVTQEASDAFKQGLGFFKTALLVFAFVALFVGAFIIFNTFSIIVAQRTRELGLLRALGASRRQVMASVAAEAVILGLVASVVGIGVGVAIAAGLRALMEGFGIDIPGTRMQILGRTVIASLIVGTGVTFVSAIVPARRAAKVSPVEALRDEAAARRGRSLRRRVVVGLVIAVLGVLNLAFGLYGGAANAGAAVGLGAALTFLGVAILSPLVARPLARLIGAPLPRMGISGKLGRENAMRNPRRTAATAAALMIGLGLVSFVTIFAASLKASASLALEETLKADFVLTASTFTGFSPDVAARLGERPQLAAVSGVRQGEFRVDGERAFVGSVDPASIADVVTIDLEGGSVESLESDAILVHDQTAEEHGWEVGDSATFEFARTGKQDLVIGGIFTDDRLLGSYVISTEMFERSFSEQLDTFVLVKGAAGVPPEDVREAVELAVDPFPNIDVQDQAGFREKQAGFVDQLLAMVWALLGLAIVIAVFGIVNTLGLSIFERVRELGLVRAVGMSRWQVRLMIVYESVIIAVLGAVLGLVIGFLFAWAVQQALSDEGITEFSVPIGLLVVYFVLAGIVGVLAAGFPARRAAKLDVLEAIAYE